MSKPPPTLPQFLKKVEVAQAAGTLVSLRLHPLQGHPVDLRPVDLREGPALSAVTHEERRDLTRNLTPQEGITHIHTLMAEGGTAWLRTTGKAWQWINQPGQRPRLVAHDGPATAQPSRAHDRIKKHLRARPLDWMQALGLTDEQGRPKPGRSDKIRQVERYADLLGHLLRDAAWPAGSALRVADMGCGKGYLTFAAWHLLRDQLKMDATVLGLDAQASVIASAQQAAKSISAQGLEFSTGTIQDAALPAVDILIALHACNDATDLALRRGVEAGARIIVVAPCCHKDVRRCLGTPPPLGPLLQHGLFKERFAEWLTDGLRVLALEAAGYRVTVSEFVDAVHTPKNVLIGAVRGNSADRQAAARAEFLALKTWAGLTELPVDALLR